MQLNKSISGRPVGPSAGERGRSLAAIGHSQPRGFIDSPTKHSDARLHGFTVKPPFKLLLDSPSRDLNGGPPEGPEEHHPQGPGGKPPGGSGGGGNPPRGPGGGSGGSSGGKPSEGPGKDLLIGLSLFIGLRLLYLLFERGSPTYRSLTAKEILILKTNDRIIKASMLTDLDVTSGNLRKIQRMVLAYQSMATVFKDHLARTDERVGATDQKMETSSLPTTSTERRQSSSGSSNNIDKDKPHHHLSKQKKEMKLEQRGRTLCTVHLDHCEAMTKLLKEAAQCIEENDHDQLRKVWKERIFKQGMGYVDRVDEILGK